MLAHHEFQFHRTWVVIIVACITVACSPESDDPGVDGGDKPELVVDLKGYRYEGTFRETAEPTAYREPTIWHLEEYQDSLRVLFTTYDRVTEFYRWTVFSLHKGKVNRKFEPYRGTPNPAKHKFAFNHKDFELLAYSVPESYVTYLSKTKAPSGFYLSKINSTFPYRFHQNYTVFFNGEASIYSYENNQQRYTAPAPTSSYVLTSEPSVAWADYVIHDDAASATLFREEIITCFFNATLDRYNYIGIAKGQQTLDTLVVNNYVPTLYYPITSVFASQVGNTVYLGLKKIKGQYQQDDISVYKMDLTEKIIRPIYKNIDAPHMNVWAFVAGKFYYNGQMLNEAGQLVDIPLPEFVPNVWVMRYHYGASRLYIVLQKDVDWIELYSKPY